VQKVLGHYILLIATDENYIIHVTNIFDSAEEFDALEKAIKQLKKNRRKSDV
jgi:hypothetical protein